MKSRSEEAGKVFEIMQREIIRTALFVPGDRPDRIDKALRFGADAVIIDLEDAVAVSSKEEARHIAKEKVTQFGKDHFIIVRVNAKSTGLLGNDVDEVVLEGLSGIMLPKVEDYSDIEHINILLEKQERKKGIATGIIKLFPLVESAKGIENISSILFSGSDLNRLYTVAFGAADYTFDMGIGITEDGIELIYPRSRIAIACISAGIKPPLDTPFMIDIKSVEKTRADARRAKRLGFGGKLCIHPIQVKPCNKIFSPSEKEIEYAKRVIEVFEESEEQGTVAIQLDGKFIDSPIVQRSRRIVELAMHIKNL